MSKINPKAWLIIMQPFSSFHAHMLIMKRIKRNLTFTYKNCIAIKKQKSSMVHIMVLYEKKSIFLHKL